MCDIPWVNWEGSIQMYNLPWNSAEIIAAFGPLRASLHRKGRRSKDEVADQSLISSIRVSCKSSLADCRMLACPKAEIVDSLDKAD